MNLQRLGTYASLTAVTVGLLFAAFASLAPLASVTASTSGAALPTHGPAVLLQPTATCGQSAVALGAASSFAALSGTAVTSTGATALTGDIGVSPGSSVTGFPPGTYSGAKDVANTASQAAEAALALAYTDAAGRSNCPILVAGNLGGQTLTPGLYKSTSSLAISSGDLTLSGGGNPNGVFVFQVASALTTTSGRAVILTNGAQAGNIFWQIGSSATIGTTSTIQGTIMAYASITMSAGAHVNGRALAKTGDVTLSASTIVVPTTTTATTYPATFTESGLATGTTWSATLGGVVGSSATAVIQFDVVSGSYAYAIGVLGGYGSTPSSGSVTVNGAATDLGIDFVVNSAGTYSVLFTESGLISGTTWSVSLGGHTQSSATPTIGFTLANGTQSYTVGAAPGFSVSPSSGSVTVAGNTLNQAIEFSATSTGGGPGGTGGSGTSGGVSSWPWLTIGILAVIGAIAAVGGVAVAVRRRRR